MKPLLLIAVLALAGCATNADGDRIPLAAEEYALIVCKGYKVVLATANVADKAGQLSEENIARMLKAIDVVDGRCSSETPPTEIIGPATVAISLLSQATGG